MEVGIDHRRIIATTKASRVALPRADEVATPSLPEYDPGPLDPVDVPLPGVAGIGRIDGAADDGLGVKSVR